MFTNTPLPFHIEFYGPQGTIIRVSTIYAIDHMDACEQAWDTAPEGADDFLATELDQYSE